MNTLKLMTLALISACGAAHAGPVFELDAGEHYEGLSGITNTQMNELRGAIVFDEYQDFVVEGGTEGDGSGLLFEGTFLTRLVRSHDTGNLTFNFRFFNNNTDLSGEIKHIEITGFSGQRTRVEYRNEPGFGDFGAASASRSVDGDMLSFNFAQGFQDDNSSKFFFAMTDVAEYDFEMGNPIATIYLYSGEAVTVDIVAPIPNPGSLALLGTAGLLATRRRR